MSVALDPHYTRAFARGWQREPPLTVSEWADAERMLADVSSPEPGRWRTSRTPYIREPMDSLSTMSRTWRTVLQFGTQLGKTEAGKNWIGYVIRHAPGPLMVVMPTLDMARTAAQQRIGPMIEETPTLRPLVRDLSGRDQQQRSAMRLRFPGGMLFIVTANSASALSSRPLRYIFLDEVDRYPLDVDQEGDPVRLAERRIANYPGHRMLLTSSPGIRGISRIERDMLKSEWRRYFVPCPFCGWMDWIQWRIGGYRGDEGRHHHIWYENHDPKTACMRCAKCDAKVLEMHKGTMLAAGQWRPTAKIDEEWREAPVREIETAGYHLPSLYSPLGWKTWESCVTEFLEVQHDSIALKTWVNTVLAETFEETGDSVEVGALHSRLETYAAEVPHGVGALVAAIDTQGDRLEVVVIGYGAREESWLVMFTQLWGDPAKRDVWFELDRLLAGKFKHASGRMLPIDRAVIDSGGLHTEEVYRFCKARLGGHWSFYGREGQAEGFYRGKGFAVLPVRGGKEQGKPLVQRPSLNNRYHVPLFTLCVDTGKEIIMSRMQIARPKDGAPAPGYMHLPHGIADAEYLAQLASEKAIRKYVKGRGVVREWVQLRPRNEALDLNVYALAALHTCGATFIRALGERARVWSQPAPAPGAKKVVMPKRRRASWINPV